MIGHRCSLSAALGCAIGALLPVSAVIATALPSLSLMAGRELPLFFSSAIESGRVEGEDIATVSIEGKRLSIKGTRPGSTQVILQLSGEISPRTFVIKVEAAQDGGRLLVSPESSVDQSAKPQEAVLPHAENGLAQTRSSHSDVQIASKLPLPQDAGNQQQSINDADVQRVQPPRQEPIASPPVATAIAPAATTNTSKSNPSQSIAYVQPLLNDQGKDRLQKEESLAQGAIDPGTAPVQGHNGHAEGGVGPGGITLLQAVNRGLALHPDVKSPMAKVEQFTTEVAIAEGGYYPSLEASAGPTKSMSGDLSYNYNLTATQMLYDWGRVESQVDSASANLRQQTEALLVMREDAALDISEIYLDVLTYRQKIKTVRGQIERLKELNELGRQRGEAGYMDRSELGRVGLELARAHEQLAKEQGNLQNAVRQYQELTGEPPEALEEPALEAFSGRLADKDQLERAITASPLYRQATEKTAIEEAKVHQADAALLPQLDLEGSMLRRPIGGEMRDDAIIGLRVHVDPFQGLSNFQRTDAARQRLEAAKWDVGTSQRDIRRKVLSLIETESALKWREPAIKEQIKNAGDVSAVYREQFVVGLRTMNELLNIFLEHFEAERQFIDLQYERKRVQYRAAAQLGQLVPLLEGRLSETVTP